MSYQAFAPVADIGSCFTTVNPNQAATGSPARMMDGRLFTDYRPRCHQYSLKAAQTWGENEARMRMVHGADELAEAARQLNNRKATAIHGPSCVAEVRHLRKRRPPLHPPPVPRRGIQHCCKQVAKSAHAIGWS